jgi:pyrimidine-nucleoside phosphorylase
MLRNPLGQMVGNSLEVIESIEILKGRGPTLLVELCLKLAAQMVYQAGITPTLEEAKEKVSRARMDGRGLEKFREIISKQGGDPRVIDDYSLLPTAPYRINALPSPASGYLLSMNAEKIGRASMILGAGRLRADQAVDHRVGIRLHHPIGAKVARDEPLLEFHCATPTIPPEALAMIENIVSVDFAETDPTRLPLAKETLP